MNGNEPKFLCIECGVMEVDDEGDVCEDCWESENDDDEEDDEE